MPKYFKKKRTYRKRKPYTRRKRALVTRKPRYMPIGGFSNSKLVKLRYVSTISLNPGAGLIARHVFRANSLYDPDSSSVGHQPSNFDRWMQNYDHFTVLGSKFKAVYTPVVATTVTPGRVGLLLSDTGTVVAGMTSVENLLEQPRMNVSSKVVGIPSGNSIPLTISKYFSSKKFFSVSPLGAGKTYQGTASSNPAEGAFYELFLASIDGNDPGAAYFTVTIDYIALLTEPKESDFS